MQAVFSDKGYERERIGQGIRDLAQVARRKVDMPGVGIVVDLERVSWRRVGGFHGTGEQEHVRGGYDNAREEVSNYHLFERVIIGVGVVGELGALVGGH